MKKFENCKLKIENFKRGFTLLLTLITMGVVLVVGMGIFSIILKEIQLSGLGRESLIAFYAADSGAECVLYWDFKKGQISTTTVNTIKCNEQFVTVGQSEGWTVSSFNLNFDDNGACVKVDITKIDMTTKIDSHGYNFDCDSTLPRKVERGVRITY